MERRKARLAAFHIHSIPLQTGKEKSFNATHAGAALSLITLLMRRGIHLFVLALHTQLGMMFFKLICITFLPHCPHTHLLFIAAVFFSFLPSSCLVPLNPPPMNEDKRPRIDHMWASAPSMANGAFPSRTLYQPSPRLRSFSKRTAPIHS